MARYVDGVSLRDAGEIDRQSGIGFLERRGRFKSDFKLFVTNASAQGFDFFVGGEGGEGRLVGAEAIEVDEGRDGDVKSAFCFSRDVEGNIDDLSDVV